MFAKWGRVLLKEGGKEPASKSGLVTDYLGYWTDNGAYYYYNTLPELNYENTMIEMSNYFKYHNIPVRYINYDSWWYLKGDAFHEKNKRNSKINKNNFTK